MDEMDKEAKEFYEDTLQSFEEVVLGSVIDSVKHLIDEGKDETVIAMAGGSVRSQSGGADESNF